MKCGSAGCEGGGAMRNGVGGDLNGVWVDRRGCIAFLACGLWVIRHAHLHSTCSCVKWRAQSVRWVVVVLIGERER